MRPILIFPILFLAAMAVSSVGWKKFVYFLSIGYGYSVAACAVLLAVYFKDSLSWANALLCLLLFVYGCRLGTFVLMRELQSASYRKALPELTKTSRPVTPAFKFAIWVSVALLYVMEVSPVAFRSMRHASGWVTPTAWAYAGAAVMALGLLLESLSDAQKSAAKKKNPHRFVDSGLFAIVRCPNYLGEVIFWTGCFISGIGTYVAWWHWVVAAAGYLSIVYIMFGGARRLELRQNKNYGSDPDYQDYVCRTPILLPLVPLYSVAKYKWLKG